MNVFPQTARSPSEWLSHRLWEIGMRPAWSGHGMSRPWMWDDRFDMTPANAMPRQGAVTTPTARVRALADRAGRLADYGRRVLLGAEG